MLDKNEMNTLEAFATFGPISTPDLAAKAGKARSFFTRELKVLRDAGMLEQKGTVLRQTRAGQSRPSAVYAVTKAGHDALAAHWDRRLKNPSVAA